MPGYEVCGLKFSFEKYYLKIRVYSILQNFFWNDLLDI